MGLWQEIKRRWDYLPDPIPYVRLENHLTHMFGGVVIAMLLHSFILNWIIVGAIILGGLLIREGIQMVKEREVLLVAVFDVWQYHFYVVFLFLYYHMFWQFAIALVVWVIGYVIFLLKDDDWFYDKHLFNE